MVILRDNLFGSKLYDNANLTIGKETELHHIQIFGMTRCQPKGSKVLMANGEWKNIEDIKVGDEVLSPQKDGSKINAKVKEVHHWISPKIFGVYNGNNLLYSCAFNHEIPVVLRNKADNIQAFKVFRKNKTFFTLSYSGDKHITISCRLKKIGGSEVYGFSLDSPSHWYITDNWMVTCNSGKGVTLEKWMTVLFESRKCKIFDLWDAARFENAFYLLPSRFRKWKEGIEDTKGRVWKATSYPTNLLFPHTSDLPKELPPFSKVFTVPINSLTRHDIYALAGNMISENTLQLFDYVISERVRPSTTAPELQRMIAEQTESKSQFYNKMGYKVPKADPRNAAVLMRVLNILIKEKLITSSLCPTCLDIRGEYNARTITSLITKFVRGDSPLRLWLIQWLIRNIYNYIETLEGKNKRLAYIALREAADLIPKNCLTPQQEMIKQNIHRILKQGIGTARLRFIIDTQNPAEIDLIKGQFGITVFHKIKFEDQILDFMKSEARSLFKKEDREMIYFLPKGYTITITPAGRFRSYIIPPRCCHKREQDDFFEEWKKYCAKMGWKPFVNFSKEFEAIENDYKRGIEVNKGILARKYYKMMQKGEIKESEGIDISNVFHKEIEIVKTQSPATIPTQTPVPPAIPLKMPELPEELLINKGYDEEEEEPIEEDLEIDEDNKDDFGKKKEKATKVKKPKPIPMPDPKPKKKPIAELKAQLRDEFSMVDYELEEIKQSIKKKNSK